MGLARVADECGKWCCKGAVSHAILLHAKSVRSRHYHGVGLARVAVHIIMVVVGRSEVVTMADTPAVSGKVDRCAIGEWLPLLSVSHNLGSVRFYHAISVGHHPM